MFIFGMGRLASRTSVEVTAEDGTVTTLEAKNILLAMGSIVRELPFAKSNGTTIHTSDTALFIDEVPDSMCVVGAVLWVWSFYRCYSTRFGCDVTVVEMAPNIVPSCDVEAAKELAKAIKKQNVKV